MKPFDYLVVLDFEWTCDRGRAVSPAEIIEFPSVLVSASFPAAIVDEFQVYCRPKINPRLSKFCTELTAITQDQVDAGLPLEDALREYEAWLRRSGCLDSTFAFVTWGDSDIMSTLSREMRAKNIAMPPYFSNWINLKLFYKRHYKR